MTGPEHFRGAEEALRQAHDRLGLEKYVLRPPGEDPKAILRAARLVLPEGPYEELADQLGVPAGWPAG
jgi:hypothetical protein